MKKIKILIIFFLIISIGLVITILYINKNNIMLKKSNPDLSNITPETKKEYYIDVPAEGLPDSPTEDEKEIDAKIKEVTDINSYFTIKSIIEQYYVNCKNLSIKAEDIEVYRTAINQEELNKYKQERAKELKDKSVNALYSILGEEYIKEFQISKNKIETKFKKQYNYSIIEKIDYCNTEDNLTIYLVSGLNINTKNNDTGEFNIIVVTDNTNNIYSIYENEFIDKYNIKSITGNKIDKKFNKPQKNDFNTFESKFVSDNYVIAREYFNNYIYLLKYKKEKAYYLLNSEYVKARFGSMEEFNTYLKDNSSVIDDIAMNKYKKTSNNGSDYYTYADQYNNIYIFKINSLTKYEVFWDNYTILMKEDLNKYNKASKLDKATLNINKFLNMVNTKDYKGIFNVLNSTFRYNNFKNINELKQYIKNNFFEVNGIEITKDKENNNYYTFKCIIINQRNKNENKELNIIISKTDDINFNMSFSF